MIHHSLIGRVLKEGIKGQKGEEEYNDLRINDFKKVNYSENIQKILKKRMEITMKT